MHVKLGELKKKQQQIQTHITNAHVKSVKFWEPMVVFSQQSPQKGLTFTNIKYT